MGTATHQKWREAAAKRWWLTDAEIEHYGIDIDPERISNYLSLKAFHTRIRYDVAEKDQWVILDNKWFFANFCKGCGIPHPTTFGVLKFPQGVLANGSALRSVVELTAWCRSTKAKEFVLKPVAGGASTGIFVIERLEWNGDQVRFHIIGRGVLSEQELADQLVTDVPWRSGACGVLLQERAIMPYWFSEHNLGIFNILRILTFVPDESSPIVQAAILVSGRLGHAVNTWVGGAISIHIDLATGVLGAGRTLPNYGREPFNSHPDTGTVFTGLQLPDWREALQLAIRAAQLTIGMRLVCWEVLLTDSGPQLLEGNWGFGLTNLQVHSEGFLKNGVCTAWKQAGADLPDGSAEWVDRTSHVPSGSTHSLRAKIWRKTRHLLGRIRNSN